MVSPAAKSSNYKRLLLRAIGTPRALVSSTNIHSEAPVATMRAGISLLFVAFASVAMPWTVSAQQQPLCVGCSGDYVVNVTPDFWPATAVAAVPTTVIYSVSNDGNLSDTYSLVCHSVGSETCGLVSPASLSLNAHAAANVSVTFTPGNAGTSGTLRLVATGSGDVTVATDSGSFNVTNIAAPMPVPALVNQNGDNIDRSLCLTAGAGEAAGWACGDLVVTHGLPKYATMGKERSLTLLYNSGQSIPQPYLAVNVSVPARMATTPAVYLEFHLGYQSIVNRASSTWTGWDAVNYAVPQVRQLALSFVDTTEATGVYPFSLLVRYQYSTGPKDSTLSGNLVIVNRSQSQYGRGWSLVGVEQLYFNQPVGVPNASSILLVRGDGSARLYSPAGTNKWVAPPGSYRDTIYYNAASATYTDTLRQKIVVTFDGSGRHTKTTSRVGQSSLFVWNQTTSRLDSIVVPPVGTAGTVYKLVYDANGKLDRITDPANRLLDVTVVGNRLTSMLDPDTNIATGFGYDGPGRMVSRTTRRGYTTRYAYAHGLRLTSDSVRIDTAGATTPVFAITSFQPWDEKGLATGPTGQVAIDTASVYTMIDGPRTNAFDIGKFWVDRWGSPTRMINPLGATNTILRGNSTVPALPTRLTYPDGRIITLTWDALGNLTQLRDSTSHLSSAGLPTRVARFTYNSDSTRFSPDSLIDSAETGALVTRLVYNRWGLLRDVTAPNGHKTHFDFLTALTDSGLVRAVTELAVPAWDTVSRTNLVQDRRRAFGFNTLGNVVSDTSPMGHLMTYTRDAFQRVTHVIDPLGHDLERVYDALNRVRQIKRHVEGVDSGYTQPLVATYRYVIDVLDSIADQRGVSRTYRYDAAGRRTKEINDYGRAAVSYYDPSGLVDSIRTQMDTVGRPQVIRQTYNAAGQLIKMAWPALTPTSADSITYTYDLLGRLLTATSSARKVTRTYFGVGDVKTEVQSTAGGANPNTLTYAYDRLGRRLFYLNGTPGSSTNSDSIFYHYELTSGELKTIGVRWRQVVNHAPPVAIDSVVFHFDTLGRRDKVTYVWPGVVTHLAYDGDGQLRLVCANQNPPQSGLDRVFNFTRYDATVDGDGLTRRTTGDSSGLSSFGCSDVIAFEEHATFDSRHQLLLQVVGPYDSLIYRYDASGNRVKAKNVNPISGFVRSVQVAKHDSTHNRLRMTLDSIVDPFYTADSVHYGYEASGGRGYSQPWYHGSPQCGPANRQYAYDALGRTTGTLDMSGCLWVDNTLQCVYDPIGRLIKPCENVAVRLAYDGHNVVRTGDDQNTSGFTFVNGPANDDPLIAFVPSGVSGLPKYFYYVTDGRGRQLAVGDHDGCDLTNDTCNPNGHMVYAAPIWGGIYAGGTTHASGFRATRDSNDQAPELSFFRNRFYDQATGRWTQEDPIGLAGGLNLYGYVGNNPVSFIDPFGLKCPDGLRDRIRSVATDLRARIERFLSFAFEGWNYKKDRPFKHDLKIGDKQRELTKYIDDWDKCKDDKDNPPGGGIPESELEGYRQLIRYMPVPKLIELPYTQAPDATGVSFEGLDMDGVKTAAGIGVVAVLIWVYMVAPKPLPGPIP